MLTNTQSKKDYNAEMIADKKLFNDKMNEISYADEDGIVSKKELNNIKLKTSRDYYEKLMNNAKKYQAQLYYLGKNATEKQKDELKKRIKARVDEA